MHDVKFIFCILPHVTSLFILHYTQATPVGRAVRAYPDRSAYRLLPGRAFFVAENKPSDGARALPHASTMRPWNRERDGLESAHWVLWHDHSADKAPPMSTTFLVRHVYQRWCDS